MGFSHSLPLQNFFFFIGILHVFSVLLFVEFFPSLLVELTDFVVPLSYNMLSLSLGKLNALRAFLKIVFAVHENNNRILHICFKIYIHISVHNAKSYIIYCEFGFHCCILIHYIFCACACSPRWGLDLAPSPLPIGKS